MFEFLKKNFFSFCSAFASKALAIFSGNVISDNELEQFFELLISFDVGAPLARDIINKLKEEVHNGMLQSSENILSFVKKYLLEILSQLPKIAYTPQVILFLGINGAGKTTTAAKLAKLLVKNNKRVLLVAADTYRAAAVDQLLLWADMAGADLFVGKEGADPSSVIFDAAKFAENKSFDHVIIDTAGRLHTNINLLKELEKAVKVTERVFQGKTIASWVVLDSILGQNSFEQVKTFSKAVKIDGIVLTKLDGTAKGGVVFAIAKNFSLPIAYITVAENDLTGIRMFDAEEYVDRLFCNP